MRTNAEYRRYMTTNATKIMESNLNHACENLNVRGLHVGDFGASGTGPPYTFKSAIDSARPFGYETNATKESYINEYVGYYRSMLGAYDLNAE